ncbi:MAG: D-alanyl-D-alanine carboxypeptidase family protein [Erysipelotrichaceae bacterium]|nr:D-alanyl-D-alanine carboxypeptidase family protein [Erysipelotrichaceae bacterium]
MTVKKKRRRLNGRFVALLAAVILVCLSLYKVPHFINTNRLLDLGYSEEAVKAIYRKGLRSVILKNSYYSDYLDQEIVKDDFNRKYLRLYLVCDYLDNDYFELYENLKERKEYTDDELEALYGKLKIHDLRPLLIFDKLEDIDAYTEDCLAHPENSDTVFEVNGDYLHPYENYVEAKGPGSVIVYVSPKSSIGNYEPQYLVEINSENAIPGVMLESRALSAYYDLCKAIRQEDLDMAIYAVGGYISYEEQKILHMQDETQLKEGFADTQTGMGVFVTNEESSSFKDTRVYSWLLDNAYRYGFIQRYPEGKEALTGHRAVPNYFRFVGPELAEKVHESGLCFDEYYYYHPEDWELLD